MFPDWCCFCHSFAMNGNTDDDNGDSGLSPLPLLLLSVHSFHDYQPRQITPVHFPRLWHDAWALFLSANNWKKKMGKLLFCFFLSPLLLRSAPTAACAGAQCCSAANFPLLTTPLCDCGRRRRRRRRCRCRCRRLTDPVPTPKASPSIPSFCWGNADVEPGLWEEKRREGGGGGGGGGGGSSTPPFSSCLLSLPSLSAATARTGEVFSRLLLSRTVDNRRRKEKKPGYFVLLLLPLVANCN